MSDRVFNVLFLCTGNSARSIIAEAVLTSTSKGRFKAYSAGSHPAGAVHPLTLEVLHAAKYPVEDLRSKSWDEFAASGAPPLDFVFTVCDKAAGEVCPTWPGQPITAHWGFEDPVSAQGSEEQRRAVFKRVLLEMRTRISFFVNLPIAKLDRLTLEQRVRDIGSTRP